MRHKQIVFVDEYLRTWNATRAAKAAGYSEKTARSMGSENLTKPDIKALIEKRLAEFKMEADEVLVLLAAHARASLEPFIKVTKDGFIYFDFSQLSAVEHMHLIKKIKSKRTRRIDGPRDHAKEWEDEIVEIELVDSQAALFVLAKYHQLFNNKLVTTFGLDIEGLDEMLQKIYGIKKEGT